MTEQSICQRQLSTLLTYARVWRSRIMQVGRGQGVSTAVARLRCRRRSARSRVGRQAVPRAPPWGAGGGIRAEIPEISEIFFTDSLSAPYTRFSVFSFAVFCTLLRSFAVFCNKSEHKKKMSYLRSVEVKQEQNRKPDLLTRKARGEDCCPEAIFNSQISIFNSKDYGNRLCSNQV